ncbi:MAG: dienelactone hydrolase family protein [Clostridia bacterium]|nr:dienelactone hydrolase family protein [Clostridia bacterium]
MIVSAVSLWKQFNVDEPLDIREWGVTETDGMRFSHVRFCGHRVEDGAVRIYARWIKPTTKGKTPAIVLLGDAGKPVDEKLARFFADKGYAVLMPDYSGKMQTDEEGTPRTEYPESLTYANLEQAKGFLNMVDISAEKSCWFEWTYVALYAVEFLKRMDAIGNVGVVGIRVGGDIAWHTLLSPKIKCGVPINSVGWKSFASSPKFGENTARNLSDETHRYIAAVEAQSYAPYVKCPVLMLCALRDDAFDCDRAYDTFSRLGGEGDSALYYAPESGSCLGPNAIIDMELFLEKTLKGREIYIPETPNVTINEVEDGIDITFEGDSEGILEEAGLYYAEADFRTKCAYRDWHKIYSTDGKSVKNNKFTYHRHAFGGAQAVYVFAYAKYINGFRVMSKIASRRISKPNPSAVKSRMLFSGEGVETFSVAEYKGYSLGDIFLERTAVPSLVTGYGNVQGVFSIGGVKTYKISSPRYEPEENAELEFDAYFQTDDSVIVRVEVGDMQAEFESYVYETPIKCGGKWKRVIVKAGDFKSETTGMPLKSFTAGRAITFDCLNDDTKFAITNILWL